MNYEVLNLNQKDEWNYYLGKLPETNQDVNFCFEYYELIEKSGMGQARCFVFDDGVNTIIYPFLLNSINKLNLIKLDKEYYDIQGAYGYNGASGNTTNSEIIEQFNNSFLDYCKSNNIIAEFVRFNPVLRNEIYMDYISPISTNDVIIIDLNSDLNKIWDYSFESATRGSIRKAIKNNLKHIALQGEDIKDNHIKDFVKIYRSTMARNNADPFYFFNESFFFEIVRNLGDKASINFVFKDEIPVSTSLNMHYHKRVYGFLAGTIPEYFALQPFSFLIHKSIEYYKNRGLSDFFLGGGLTRGDKIFKFKKGFSRTGSFEFFIGKKIHNENVYNQLCEAWENKYPEKKEKYKNFLLKYREVEP